jgi:hypothetical protein
MPKSPPHRPGFAGPPLPLPGGEVSPIAGVSTPPRLGFLSPGQGGPKDGRDKWLAPERWLPQADGEGVLAPLDIERHP